MPLEPKIREIAGEFQPGRADFLEALAEFLSRKYRVTVRTADWPPQSLPPHLRPRVEIVDRRNQTVAAGRDLGTVQAAVENRDVRSDAWDKAVRQWEKTGAVEWTFGDLPESVVIEEVGGAPLFAYPGLEAREAAVDVRLFRKREEAAAASPSGVRRLAELVLARDLSRLWKDLANLAKPPPMAGKPAAHFHDALQQMTAKLPASAAATVTPDVLQKSAYQHLLDHTLVLTPLLPLTAARFQALLDSVRRELPALTWQLGDSLRQILALRQAVLAGSRRYATLEQDVQRLVPPDFLARTPYAQLPHLLRYLRAVQVRAERASLNPAKDAEKARQFAPFLGWEKHVPAAQREAFRWLLEEFRVSLFAQELGTAQPASAQRLRTLGGY